MTMDIYARLRKIFIDKFNLNITQFSIDTQPDYIYTSSGQAAFAFNKEQTMNIELESFSNRSRTISLQLILKDDMLAPDKIDFDSNTAKIPDSISGEDRILMRLGYMIHAGCKVLSNPDEQAPAFVKSCSIRVGTI